MKQRDTWMETFICRYCELDALEVYLEEKAAQGWYLEEKTENYCTFRRGEPRKVQFFADVVISDGEADKEQWEAAGWNEVFNDSRIRIFEHEDLRVKPIEVNQKKRLKEVHKKSKWSCVYWPLIGVLFLGGFSLLLVPWGAWILSNFQTIGIVISVPIMLTACMVSMVSYLLWYGKARRQASAGLCFATKRRMPWKNWDIWWWSYFLMYVGGALLNRFYIRNVNFCYFTMIMLAMVCILGIVYARLWNRQVSNMRRRLPLLLMAGIVCLTVGVGIYTAKTGTWWTYDKTEIPVSMEELGVEEADSENAEAELSATPWLTEWYYSDESAGDEEYIYYTVYTTDYQNVYHNLLRQEYLETDWYDFKEAEADVFGADGAWFDEGNNSWLLTKGKTLILFEGTLVLNDTQKRIIGERLLGEI